MDSKLFETIQELKKESNGKPFWQTALKIAKDEYGILYRDQEQLRDKYRKHEKQFGKSESVSFSKKAPKVLLFDIESSKMLVKTFDVWEQNIPNCDIVKHSFIFCFSAKWLYDEDMISYCVTPREAVDRNDRRVVSELWSLINQSDYVIAHNGDGFDIKKANTRFIYYDMNPPMSFKSIDTLKLARSNFDFCHNSLEALGDFLGLGHKIENEKGLWDRCEEGDKKSLDDMVRYCNQDVRLLESVYLKLRPFAKNHPNFSLYGDFEGECPVCFGKNTVKLSESKLYDGKYMTGRCSNCGAPVRGKKNMIDKKDFKNIVVR